MEKKKYVKPVNKTLNMYADEMMVDIIITSNPNTQPAGAKDNDVWADESSLPAQRSVWDD